MTTYEWRSWWLRWLHCLVFWHQPVDGDLWYWCADCGQQWAKAEEDE